MRYAEDLSARRPRRKRRRVELLVQTFRSQTFGQIDESDVFDGARERATGHIDVRLDQIRHGSVGKKPGSHSTFEGGNAEQVEVDGRRIVAVPFLDVRHVEIVMWACEDPHLESLSRWWRKKKNSDTRQEREHAYRPSAERQALSGEGQRNALENSFHASSRSRLRTVISGVV